MKKKTQVIYSISYLFCTSFFVLFFKWNHKPFDMIKISYEWYPRQSLGRHVIQYFVTFAKKQIYWNKMLQRKLKLHNFGFIWSSYVRDIIYENHLWEWTYKYYKQLSVHQNVHKINWREIQYKYGCMFWQQNNNCYQALSPKIYPVHVLMYFNIITILWACMREREREYETNGFESWTVKTQSLWFRASDLLISEIIWTDSL